MKSYSNLPPQQRMTQRLADQFNTDEQLWRRLEGKRKRRRKLGLRTPEKWHKQLDLLEFAKVRPPQDCIGNTEALCKNCRIPGTPYLIPGRLRSGLARGGEAGDWNSGQWRIGKESVLESCGE